MVEKNFEIDTTSECGYIYINNLDGEHMSWSELEETLNRLHHENQQLKKELRYIQFKLHNATLDVRARTLKEVSDAIEKMKRYE